MALKLIFQKSHYFHKVVKLDSVLVQMIFLTC